MYFTVTNKTAQLLSNVGEMPRRLLQKSSITSLTRLETVTQQECAQLQVPWDLVAAVQKRLRAGNSATLWIHGYMDAHGKMFSNFHLLSPVVARCGGWRCRTVLMCQILSFYWTNHNACNTCIVTKLCSFM